MLGVYKYGLKKINIDEYEITDKEMIDYFKKENATFYLNENNHSLYERCPDEQKRHWIGYSQLISKV